MNTALVSLALAGILNAPSWQTSYHEAQRHAVAQRRPIAVVFAPGPNAWSKVIRDPSPSQEVNKLLTDRYVCVFVDTQSDAGKRLAQTFEIATDRGLILSDHSGSVQAFWHQGDLTNDAITRYLTKYADPSLVVQGTETVAPPRPTSVFQQPAFAPIRTVNC